MLANYTLNKQNENKQLLRTIDIIREWNLIKLTEFSEKLQEITYHPGQTIYSIGDPAENVFIVKRGKIQLEIYFEIKSTIQLPVLKDKYTTKIQT